jgi:hypothetical protein
VQSRLGAAGNGPVSPEADWAELITGPQPAVTEPAPAPAEPDPANFGLPTRIRQASLTPQLREPAGPDVAPGRSPGLPSPDAARNTMAALQRGWELGRSAADGPSAPDAGVPPAADND